MEIKTIVVAKDGKYFRADSPDFSGSPIVGIGNNKYEAVGSFLYVHAQKMGLRIVDMADGSTVYDFTSTDPEYIEKQKEMRRVLLESGVTLKLVSADRPE
jgi:hypothetical protein